MSWTISAFADEAGDSIEAQIAALQRAGLKHIDVRGVAGHNISVLPVDVARDIAKKLQAAGITVNMFGSPLGKIDIAEDFAIDLQKLRHMAGLKDIFGCGAIRIFSYYNRVEKRPMDQWQRESLDRLTQLRDEAGKLGLVLYHENEAHIFGDRLPEVLTIAEKLRDGGGGVFRMIFDFDNYNRSGDDVWHNWTKLASLTDAIHLKDSDTQGQHVPVGQGNGKVREILSDAVSRGWQGPLSIEPHLKHSKAVMATGPGGQANQQYTQMGEADCFHAAAVAALSLVKDVQSPRGE